jgi:hypothetical protein
MPPTAMGADEHPALPDDDARRLLALRQLHAAHGRPAVEADQDGAAAFRHAAILRLGRGGGAEPDDLRRVRRAREEGGPGLH